MVEAQLIRKFDARCNITENKLRVLLLRENIVQLLMSYKVS